MILSSHDLELSFELALELALELWNVNDGKLIFGRPDKLILDGAVADAFDSSDVCFDPEKRRSFCTQVMFNEGWSPNG